jgi:hypothetical protein
MLVIGVLVVYYAGVGYIIYRTVFKTNYDEDA